MNRLNGVVVILCACLLLCTPAVAALYTWTGGGSTNDWDDGDNWSSICASPPCPCCPFSSNDDAGVATGGCSSCTINLVDDTIDDFSVSAESVTFDDGDSSDPELQVDSFLATNGSHDVEIRISNGAIIKRSAP